MRKYELTGEVKKMWLDIFEHDVSGKSEYTNLYRIRATKDFGNVKAGECGGWIEKEENLSQEGNCWVYDESCVYDEARVRGNAQISGESEVYNNAEVFDNAKVDKRSLIHGNAQIGGNAKFEHMNVWDIVWPCQRGDIVYLVDCNRVPINPAKGEYHPCYYVKPCTVRNVSQSEIDYARRFLQH